MDNKDDFWNIERIVPKKKTFFDGTVVTSSIDIADDKASPNASGVDINTLFSMVNEKKGINSIESAIVKESDYSHFSSSSVILYAYVGTFNSGFSYENNFRQDALKYFDSDADADCEFVDFFSYRPSYSELSEQQMNCYLNWRHNIRNGIFNKISDSYILLLISEIVNLPDKIKPSEAVMLLVNVWENCLQSKSSLNKIFSDTLFEYCVVHDIEIPFERLEAIFYKTEHKSITVLSTLFIFDYLFSTKKEYSANDYSFILKTALSYSYSTGKHYTSNSEFKKAMDEYFHIIFGKILKECPFIISEISEKRIKRSAPVKIIKPAYLNLNVSLQIKKNLIYEYYAYDKCDVELLTLVNIAKVIENKFRSQFGIRARLAVSQIDERIKNTIDKIFSELYQKSVFKEASCKAPTKRKIEVNLDRAQSIEASSWETTKMLTEGVDIFFDEGDDSVVEDVTDNGDCLSDVEQTVLQFLVDSDVQSAIKFSEQNGVFIESVISGINEKALDLIGDIIIDAADKRIYDDYIDEVMTLLHKEIK